MNQFQHGRSEFFAAGGRHFELSVRTLPLIGGTVVGALMSGAAELNIFGFILLLGAQFLPSALAVISERLGATPQRGVLISLISIGSLLLVGAWHAEVGTDLVGTTLYLALLLATLLAGLSRAAQSWFSFVAQSVGLLLSQALLGLLAFYAQSTWLVWGTALLGAVPAFVLLAGRVARHLPAFAALGLSVEASTERRIKGAQMLFALILLSGPALAVLLAATHLVPEVFLLSPLILVRSGKLVSALSAAPGEHEVTALKTTWLAIFAALLLIVLASL